MPKRVLFVCVHNSCRSQMAEGFGRQLGGDQIEAYSAGSAPSGEVDPGAVEFMKEVGIDISSQWSKSLDEIPPVEYDFVATMGCGDACPMVRAECREDWNIADPKGKSPETYRTAREEIRRRVESLIRQLE